MIPWRPRRDLQPRTYCSVRRARRRRAPDVRAAPARRPLTAPIVRVLGVEIALAQTSYAPGETTDLTIATDAESLEVQVFHYAGAGAVRRARPADERRRGHAARARRLARAPRRAVAAPLPARGRVAERPLLRPRARGRRPRRLRAVHPAAARLGEHRVAVVLSTNTWQAYNFHDADGDGWGDSWYVSARNDERRRHAAVPRLRRPVPLPRLGPRVHRVAEPHRQAGRLPLRRRRRGGRDRRPPARGLRPRRLPRPRGVRDAARARRRRALPRARRQPASSSRRTTSSAAFAATDVASSASALARPRAAGVRARRRAVRRVRLRAAAGPVRRPRRGSRTWVFEGTGLANGSSFGRYGIELDARTAASPPRRSCSRRSAT